MQSFRKISEWLGMGVEPSEEHEQRVRKIVENAIVCAVEQCDERGIEKVLDFIRKECHFEMTVLGTRVTWLLTAQAFLASAYVAALSNALIVHEARGGLTAFISALITALGFLISSRSRIAIDHSRYTVDLWHARVRVLLRHLTTAGHEGAPAPNCWHATILGRWTDPNDNVHRESLIMTKWLPGAFQFFWGALLVISLCVTVTLVKPTFDVHIRAFFRLLLG